MSIRVDTSSLIAGAIVCGNRGLGVLGSVIRATTATGTHGPGYLYNDWDSAADDSKEFRGLIVTPPSAGTFVAYEDGSFDLTGAPDGSYSFVYRLFVDGADLGTATAGVTIGAAGSPTGLASESDTALALAARQSAPTGLAQESDAAFARAAVQRLLVGPATESDAAISPGSGMSLPVGLATEASTAFACKAVQRRPVGRSVEVSQALALGSPGAVPIIIPAGRIATARPRHTEVQA